MYCWLAPISRFTQRLHREHRTTLVCSQSVRGLVEGNARGFSEQAPVFDGEPAQFGQAGAERGAFDGPTFWCQIEKGRSGPHQPTLVEVRERRLAAHVMKSEVQCTLARARSSAASPVDMKAESINNSPQPICVTDSSFTGRPCFTGAYSRAPSCRQVVSSSCAPCGKSVMGASQSSQSF